MLLGNRCIVHTGDRLPVGRNKSATKLSIEGVVIIKCNFTKDT